MPWTITHQAPLSMGLFQGNWSGLSFPPPGDLADLGSENMFPALKMDSLLFSNCVCVCVCACVHTRTHCHVRLCDPMDCNLPGSSVHAILQARILEWVVIPPPGNLPNPGIEPMSLASPALAGIFFTTEPSGKLILNN